MEQSRPLISSFSEAQENAVRFQDYLKHNETLQHKLSQYTHWYYFEKKNIFAPSKFIGYKDNTYNSEAHHEGDGRETEKALAHFFRKVLPSDIQPDIYLIDLYNMLATLLAKYGKKPKKNAVIHLPKEHIKK
jgi:5-methylcytosine-specific restriction protein A